MAITPGKLQTQSSAHALVIRPNTTPAKYLPRLLIYAVIALVEILTENLRPDTASGETPEVPRYEQNRGPGSTSEVSFWTSKDVREVINCHLNYAVADT